jgi:hypothetical protein
LFGSTPELGGEHPETIGVPYQIFHFSQAPITRRILSHKQHTMKVSKQANTGEKNAEFR